MMNMAGLLRMLVVAVALMNLGAGIAHAVPVAGMQLAPVGVGTENTFSFRELKCPGIILPPELLDRFAK